MQVVVRLSTRLGREDVRARLVGGNQRSDQRSERTRGQDAYLRRLKAHPLVGLDLTHKEGPAVRNIELANKGVLRVCQLCFNPPAKRDILTLKRFHPGQERLVRCFTTSSSGPTKQHPCGKVREQVVSWYTTRCRRG